MNQTFDFRRFGLVLKLHLSEHFQTYLMGISVLFGIFLLVFLPTTVKTTHFGESLYRFHSVVFGSIFCGTGAWFASEAFRVVGKPRQGIIYLTLPASQLEKYLVAFLIIMSFVVVYLAVFYSVEGVSLTIINARLPISEPRYHLLDLTDTYFPFELRLASLFVLPFFFVGSIYFAKLPFVKTSIVAFLAVFVGIFLNEYLVEQLFPPRDYYGSKAFQEVHFKQSGTWYTVELTDTSQLVVYTALLLLCIGLWFTAYVRFKEKEL